MDICVLIGDATGFGDVINMTTPTPVSNFIECFDRGMFPEVGINGDPRRLVEED